MSDYLGEFEVGEDNPYSAYTPSDWVMEYINSYGGISGGHHKDWVLDQCMRILKGTPMLLKEARWADGKSEYRFNTGEPSQAYLDYVKEVKNSGYSYEEGVAP